MPDGALPPSFGSQTADAQTSPASDDARWDEDDADGLRAANGIALSTIISAAIWIGLAFAFNWFFGR